MQCYFCSDLHASLRKYRKLFALLEAEHPEVLLLGGDLLPPAGDPSWHTAAAGGDFVEGFLIPEFTRLGRHLAERAPQTLVILGNDDPRAFEEAFLAAARRGVWSYLYNRRRPHSSLDGATPDQAYFTTLPLRPAA